MSKLTIVLDPGHKTNYNKGVYSGYYEGNAVWKLAQYLKEELENGTDQINVILTKSSLAEDPTLYNRGQVAVKNNATVFISLHSNAVGDTSKYEQAYGVSVYRSLFLPDSADLGHKLADAVVSVMRPVTGVTYSRGVLTYQSTKTGRDYYGVIRGAVNDAGGVAQAASYSVKHAFIIEHGFHTNSKECAFLADDNNLRKIAKVEADVIKEHFGITGRTEPEYAGLSIMGEAVATETQMLEYLKANNPSAAEEFADLPSLYLDEGKVEGVRGDAAFCQACKETGFFKFNGDVKKGQNNFCGLGATGGGNPGHSFESYRMGVRANIQHLKAYGSKETLVNECIDPRFKYVSRGAALTYEDLAGKWAVPGYDTKKYTSLEAARSEKDAYGDNIVAMLAKVLSMSQEKSQEAPQEPQTGSVGVIGTVKVIYEGQDGLNIHKTPEWGNINLNLKNGPVHAGEVFNVTEKVTVGTGAMYKLLSGAGYITASEKYITFTASAQEQIKSDKKVKAGDTVKVIRNVTYTGGSFKLYYDKYSVLSISGDRAVIGIGEVVTAAVNIKDIAVA
ncbi:MAG: N-acetylmuramoyl-L-alanine amidase [Acetatifactor sp.]|nr:N-acetylmuramoyl-L-alanine amidase [Acetatifactor sp.]